MPQTPQLLLLALAIGCSSQSPPTSPPPSKPQNSTPTANSPNAIESKTVSNNITLIDVADSHAIDQILTAHPGKVLVVDYWATWCPPCVKEFPHLVQLQAKYQQQIQCISVSCDYEGIDDLATVRQRVDKFLHSQDAQIVNLLVTQESDAFFKMKQIPSIPVVEIYSTDGQLLDRFDANYQGSSIYEGVEKRLAQLLAAP